MTPIFQECSLAQLIREIASPLKQELARVDAPCKQVTLDKRFGNNVKKIEYPIVNKEYPSDE